MLAGWFRNLTPFVLNKVILFTLISNIALFLIVLCSINKLFLYVAKREFKYKEQWLAVLRALHHAQNAAASRGLFHLHKYTQPRFIRCGLIEVRIYKNGNIKLNQFGLYTYICTQTCAFIINKCLCKKLKCKKLLYKNGSFPLGSSVRHINTSNLF